MSEAVVRAEPAELGWVLLKQCEQNFEGECRSLTVAVALARRRVGRGLSAALQHAEYPNAVNVLAEGSELGLRLNTKQHIEHHFDEHCLNARPHCARTALARVRRV